MSQVISSTHKTGLSFEVFPPKKEDEFENVFTLLRGFKELNPDFISCTYGAGGSRAGKTIEIASFIQKELQIDAIAHITCVGFRKEDLARNCAALKEAGVNHVLALRGDRPQSMTDEQFNSREFFYASDLVHYLKEHTDLQISGACYPEKHFESPSLEEDLQHLKEKVDAGCDYLTTQMFFDNNVYYRFLYKALAKGIDVPVVPGIMPVTNAAQVKRTISLTGNLVPAKFLSIVDRFGNDPEAMKQAGIAYATEQIIDLIANGVNHIHIYSMNKPDVAGAIMDNLSKIYVRK